MSLEGYTIAESSFAAPRGPQNLDQDTGSTYVVPVVYNVTIPTGSAERTYAQGNTSVTVIDPNGEGTCKPRLVATASFSFKIINDLEANAGAPFTSTDAITADVGAILGFFGALDYTIPAANAIVP